MLVVLAVVVLLGGATTAGIVIFRGSPDAATREKTLNGRIIDASDLPAGWTPVPPISAITDPRATCLIGTGSTGPAIDSGPVVSAVGYRSAKGVPAVVEQVENYATVDKAARRWSELMDAALHGCPGATAPGSALAASPAVILSGPAHGDQSATLSVRAGDGTTVVVFIGRVANDVVIMQMQNAGAVDKAFVEQTIRAALDKLSS